VRQRSRWLVVGVVAFAGCSRAGQVGTATPAGGRLDRAGLLACLGAPPEAIYAPERLAAPPRPGLSVHTFSQTLSSCGPVERRYLSYVPPRLAARSAAPVLIVLHGQGASAEAMMNFQTGGTFNRLADEKGLLVIYGNGLPTGYNFPGLANSGRWRAEDTEVDDVGYLDLIVADLRARGVIAGGNDLYLIGQSNGGGMVLRAAREHPDRYSGVAAFMPFVGSSPAAPADLRHTRLRRVMFAYSSADPGLPADYGARVLVSLTDGWARALGLGNDAGVADVVTGLPDVVKEGEGQGDGQVSDAPAVRATRDGTGRRLDRRKGDRALRQLVFDRAGHFWPTRQYADPEPVLRQFGLRNQDVEGADEVWAFFTE